MSRRATTAAASATSTGVTAAYQSVRPAAMTAPRLRTVVTASTARSTTAASSTTRRAARTVRVDSSGTSSMARTRRRRRDDRDQRRQHDHERDLDPGRPAGVTRGRAAPRRAPRATARGTASTLVATPTRVSTWAREAPARPQQPHLAVAPLRPEQRREGEHEHRQRGDPTGDEGGQHAGDGDVALVAVEQPAQTRGDRRHVLDAGPHRGVGVEAHEEVAQHLDVVAGEPVGIERCSARCGRGRVTATGGGSSAGPRQSPSPTAE